MISKKRFVAVLGIAAMFYPAILSAAVRIKITNIDSLKGNIYIGAYTSSSDFKNKKAYRGKIQKADSAEISLILDDLPPGWYMIAVYHDINSNGILDQNVFSIPVEPYGFSLNQMGLMGPSFEKSKFYYDGTELFLEIQLKQ